jgi:hypothetical protein
MKIEPSQMKDLQRLQVSIKFSISSQKLSRVKLAKVKHKIRRNLCRNRFGEDGNTKRRHKLQQIIHSTCRQTNVKKEIEKNVTLLNEPRDTKLLSLALRQIFELCIRATFIFQVFGSKMLAFLDKFSKRSKKIEKFLHSPSRRTRKFQKR